MAIVAASSACACRKKRRLSKTVVVVDVPAEKMLDCTASP